jgi:hypothetical protein
MILLENLNLDPQQGARHIRAQLRLDFGQGPDGMFGNKFGQSGSEPGCDLMVSP